MMIHGAKGLKRSIKKECIAFSQTLKEMQADQDSSELYVSCVVTPQIWDTVVAPTLIELECKNDPQRRLQWSPLRQAIDRFHGMGDYDAIIKAANVLDFLAVEQVLQYHYFWCISEWYWRPWDPRYKKNYENLNPGLAQQISETWHEPKAIRMSSSQCGGGPPPM